MKKYLSIIVLLSLFVVGCSEQSSINAPVNNVNMNEPNWIALPQAEGLSVNQCYAASEWIDGRDGGSIYYNNSYRRYRWYGNNVTINVEAYFPKYSFSGAKNITMIVDDKNCTATFSPHMEFNKDVIFNATFTGVDLDGVNPANVKFAYLAEDGSVEYAANDGIIVDKSRGKLVVINARIPHFSRYGFVN